MVTEDDVLGFWFGTAEAADAAELGPRMKRWYMGGDSEDRAIRAQFSDALEQALVGALDDWARTPRGSVALIILLDQMTRSVYRGTPRAFAGDATAQRLALDMLDSGSWDALPFEQRHFVLMPLLHAENPALLDRFNAVFPQSLERAPEWARPLLGDGIEQGHKYREVIARFGRFPHRNEALGRPSTADEVEFLETWADRAPPQGAAALKKL